MGRDPGEESKIKIAEISSRVSVSEFNFLCNQFLLTRQKATRLTYHGLSEEQKETLETLAQPALPQYKETLFRLRNRYLEACSGRGSSPRKATSLNFNPVILTCFRHYQNDLSPKSCATLMQTEGQTAKQTLV